MGVRVSTSYSRLAGTNDPSRIGLTSVTTGTRLRVRDRDVDASGGAAAQSRVGITLATAVSTIAIVTEDAPEPIGNVGSAVEARRRIGRGPRRDRHADHPLFRMYRGPERSRFSVFISDGVGGI